MRTLSILAFFKLLFPMRWMEDVLLANINKNIAGPRVSLGEYFRWLGLWCCMATFKGYSRHEYWSSREVDDFRGAPVRFHRWMSKRRFDAILLAMEYTDLPAPSCRDRFHRVRQMIAAWNENMTECFLPSWVSCLDESMSPWTTQWTCPGWMFVPRKPRPKLEMNTTVFVVVKPALCGVSSWLKVRMPRRKDLVIQLMNTERLVVCC